jgi:hypothetical protein
LVQEWENVSVTHSNIKFLLDSYRRLAILALGCEEC